jgi:glycosyltransferase involved in cell wall biosynthesis
MEYPKISIVTPSFNQGKYLEETILSIINQKYPNLEYIIIDGGSTDNSVEIIKKYEKHLSYWVSEKDNGQSNAINKGLKRVTGDLFNWINSDDFLEEGALFKIAEAYRDNPDKKVFCFGLYYLENNKKKLFPFHNNPENELQCFCDPAIADPSTFFATDAVTELGEVNSHLHYSMDYEWWLKCLFLYGNKSVFVSDEPIASFRIHSETKTSKGNSNFVNDMANILWSIANKVGLKKHTDLLEGIFCVNSLYEFSIPPEKISSKSIERMVIYFLLKWKRNIYTKKDFIGAKNILKEINFEDFNLSDNEMQWVKEMQANSKPASWLQFRVKRKINHIVFK